jgi:hypothetical protein
MGFDRVRCPYDPCSLMCMCQPGVMVRTSMYGKLGTEPGQEGTPRGKVPAVKEECNSLWCRMDGKALHDARESIFMSDIHKSQ